MLSQEVSDYSIYRRVVSQLMQGEEQLPSLPSITLDIRRALGDPDAVRRAFETGEYPYPDRLTERARSRTFRTSSMRVSPIGSPSTPVPRLGGMMPAFSSFLRISPRSS